MLSLKNVNAACMHLFSVGSSILLSFIAYSSNLNVWIYLSFIKLQTRLLLHQLIQKLTKVFKQI